MHILQLPAFTDNYLWLLHDGHHALVVDPGDAAPVLAALQQHGLTLGAILLTHHHPDHIGGIDALLAAASEAASIPVFGPARREIPQITHPVQPGQRIALTAPALDFEVIDASGHTRDHVAYYRPGHLFCGDALFTYGCGRLFEGTADQAHATLQRFAALPADTQIHCAHEYTANNLPFAEAIEPDSAALQRRATQDRARLAAGQPTVPSQLADELASNPFLRCEQPAVRAAAERRAGHPLGDAAAVFATLRAWRNEFVVARP